MSDIKKFFYTEQGCNTLRLTLSTDNTDIAIHYALNDNPVQYIWQEKMQASLNKPLIVDLVNRADPAYYIKELNQCLADVGLPKLTNPTREELNNLHSQFVNSTESSVWSQINVLIHKIENLLDNNSANFCLKIDTTDPTYDTRVEEFYKLWLSTDSYNWGQLLLGYDTLGKDWLDAAIDEDISVINSPATQNHIGTQTLFSFMGENVSAKRGETQFYHWYNSLKIELKQQVPIDNLNQLALGRFILGRVIIDDAFLSVDPIASNWYVPNHICKTKWNTTVFSTVTGVKALEFFNSDLAHNTLMQHTGLYAQSN